MALTNSFFLSLVVRDSDPVNAHRVNNDNRERIFSPDEEFLYSIIIQNLSKYFRENIRRSTWVSRCYVCMCVCLSIQCVDDDDIANFALSLLFSLDFYQRSFFAFCIHGKAMWRCLTPTKESKIIFPLSASDSEMRVNYNKNRGEREKRKEKGEKLCSILVTNFPENELICIISQSSEKKLGEISR